MAVDSRAIRFGYRTYSPTTHCPKCGHQMRRYYDDEARRQLSQCINSLCPEIAGKDENQLIEAIRRRKHEACNAQKEVNTMATLTATESTFETLPANKYLLQITDLEESEGMYGPQFRVKLEVVEPKKYAGKWVSYWASKKLTSGGKQNSKLWDLTEAAFNRPLGKGEQLDTDDLIGRQVVGMIDVVNKDGQEFNKVLSLKPYPKQEAFPAAGAPKPKKDETEFMAGEPEASGDFSDDDDPFSAE